MLLIGNVYTYDFDLNQVGSPRTWQLLPCMGFFILDIYTIIKSYKVHHEIVVFRIMMDINI